MKFISKQAEKLIYRRLFVPGVSIIARLMAIAAIVTIHTSGGHAATRVASRRHATTVRRIATIIATTHVASTAVATTRITVSHITVITAIAATSTGSIPVIAAAMAPTVVTVSTTAVVVSCEARTQTGRTKIYIEPIVVDSISPYKVTSTSIK